MRNLIKCGSLALLLASSGLSCPKNHVLEDITKEEKLQTYVLPPNACPKFDYERKFEDFYDVGGWFVDPVIGQSIIIGSLKDTLPENLGELISSKVIYTGFFNPDSGASKILDAEMWQLKYLASKKRPLIFSSNKVYYNLIGFSIPNLGGKQRGGVIIIPPVEANERARLRTFVEDENSEDGYSEFDYRELDTWIYDESILSRW